MDQERIGAFIRELRKVKGLTQEELAERLSVSGKSVSRWERGANMPDYSVIEPLCAALDISINELLAGERENVNVNAIALENLEVIQKQKKQAGQGAMLLGCAFAFTMAAMVFARENNMAVIFGGCSLGYLAAGMVTLLRKIK